MSWPFTQYHWFVQLIIFGAGSIGVAGIVGGVFEYFVYSKRLDNGCR